MEGLIILIGIGIVGFLYFIPTIVASSRHKTNTGAIFAMNLFLGWIFVGWVIALVWALTHDQPAAPRI